MRIKNCVGAIVAVLLSLASCNPVSSLAGKIEGSWSGVPIRLSNTESGLMTGTDNVVFIRSGVRDGDVEIATMVSFSKVLNSESSIVIPLTVTISAVTNAKGRWIVTDDDEMSVMIDTSTIEVDVDPSGVVLDTSVSGGDEVLLDSIANSVAISAKDRILQEMTVHYASFNKLDDVKVRDDRLMFEVGHERYVMLRETH